METRLCTNCFQPLDEPGPTWCPHTLEIQKPAEEEAPDPDANYIAPVE